MRTIIDKEGMIGENEKREDGMHTRGGAWKWQTCHWDSMGEMQPSCETASSCVEKPIEGVFKKGEEGKKLSGQKSPEPVANRRRARLKNPP